MELRASDRIEYWTGNVNNIADVRMYYYHLLLDMDIWSFLIRPIDEVIISNNKSELLVKDRSDYNTILKECFEISGYPEFTLTGIWPELEKWICDDNNDRITKMFVISNSTGKIIYEAKFKSNFPLMSVLYTVGHSCGNKNYKKIGYGTVKYMAKPGEAEQFYSIYDNESKKYYEGILYKLDSKRYRVYVDDY